MLRSAAVVLVAGGYLLFFVAHAAAETYRWRNVAIGGGGYVTGIAIHPKEPGRVYVRTDVGGLYRWSAEKDEEGRHWIPLTDHFGPEDFNLYGIASVALDPRDADIIYISAGKHEYNPGGLFKSTDGGASWTALPLKLLTRGNGPRRVNGERLAVHPAKPDIVFFGSFYDGLWRSTDAGATWAKVKDVPAGESGTGVMFVAAQTRKDGPTSIYAGVDGKAVYESQDDGETWKAIGGPKKPNRGVVSGSGYLFVTGEPGLQRWDGASWKNVAPLKDTHFGAIGADIRRSGLVVATVKRSGRSLPLYFSFDNGDNWIQRLPESDQIRRDNDVPWWPKSFFASAIASFAVDPHQEGTVWFTDWFGIWRSKDAYKERQRWRTFQAGHEEVVTLTLATPPGLPLISGLADVEGFVHENTDEFPREKLPGIGVWNTLGIDYSASNPKYLVRVGGGGEKRDSKGGLGISEDGGKTWKRLKWPFGLTHKVAYSATDRDHIVVLPFPGAPVVTTDRGANWTESTGLSGDTLLKQFWDWDHPLAADRVDGKLFYYLTKEAFHWSSDGGLTWKKGAALSPAGDAHVEAAPNAAGNVWVSLGNRGLVASTDRGKTFRRIDTVERARLFSFGKERTANGPPAIYIYGRIRGDNREGIFRSDNLGSSWVRIGDATKHGLGNAPNVMRGDMNQYGVVYVGTNGRGIIMGEPDRSGKR